MNITYELATGIVLKLRKAGHEAYFVGGSVRDLLRGLKPVEYDVVTSAVPEEVRFLFPLYYSRGRELRCHPRFGRSQGL